MGPGSSHLLDAIKFQDGPHVLGEGFWVRPLKMVCNGYNVLARVQGRHNLLQEHQVLGVRACATPSPPGPLPVGVSHLVHPVLALGVRHALIQRVGREDQHEVTGAQDALDQLVLELPCLQLLHVDEDAEAVQLQVDLQQAGGREETAPGLRVLSHHVGQDVVRLRSSRGHGP